MGSIQEVQIDAHLRAGGMVVTASERTACALLSTFDRARRAEGLEAWATPSISSWAGFVRELWDKRAPSSVLPLNPIQERSLWDRVITASRHPVSLLEGSRRRAAKMAMRSHALLCAYAPQFLDARRRQSWDKDPAMFSEWLDGFDDLCRQTGATSSAQLTQQLINLLRADTSSRTPLLLVGFDRLLPSHSALLDAWGQWSRHESPDPACAASFFAAPGPDTEIAACARWCSQQLARDSNARILVIAQDIGSIRGNLERAFYREAVNNPDLRFEFSLGIPLAQTGPARSAIMLLRWLSGELAESEIDWLFSSGFAAATSEETSVLLAGMHNIRRRSLERTHWSLAAFLAQTAPSLPASWTQCMRTARARLSPLESRSMKPIEWAELTPQLLDLIGWPGASSRTSAEFQSIDAWHAVVESCATLGFDGRTIAWTDFLAELREACNDAVFAAESEAPPILITGPAESAGIAADAIWFLGADEDAWPARGNLDPLLPPELQRSSGMPHAAAQDDWNLAATITRRLLASAPAVCFSYALQRDAVEMRPSRLITELAGAQSPVPPDLVPDAPAQPLTQLIPDPASIPFRCDDPAAPVELKGGSGLLTAQSQCPFRAFAIARLDAESWEPAQPGLTPADRGKLLHSIMRSIWSGPPAGLRSSGDLRALADLPRFVRNHVESVVHREFPARARDTMPARYLDLEAERLTRLIGEWLAYERTRIDFEVLNTEAERKRTIAGLSLTIRFDRLDRLADDTVLVVDYKTGDVAPSAWDLPRPDDVQLPLYAGFGLDQDTEPVGGLVFAKIRAGQMCFAGRIGEAAATIDGTLKRTSALVKIPMTLDQLLGWRDKIEQLARNLLAGTSEVDPHDPVTTCSRCEFHSLCRIHEYHRSANDDEPSEEADE